MSTVDILSTSTVDVMSTSSILVNQWSFIITPSGTAPNNGGFVRCPICHINRSALLQKQPVRQIRLGSMFQMTNAPQNMSNKQ